jgi:CHAD domain-containing protein
MSKAAVPVKSAKTPRYLEIERKFDVGASTLPPSFTGIAAITRVERPPAQELEAVYFDTPARDLASNRITLHRRTGGADAGWQLKLPSGRRARTEDRAPLDAAHGSRETVPTELSDVVLAIVRDRPLQPVARIATFRDVQLLHGANDAVLAEFRDDRITAWTASTGDEDASEQQWREWELELVGRDAADNTELLDRLGKRLLDAGTTPTPHGSKLARVLGGTQIGARARSAHPVHRAVAEQVDQLLVADRDVHADAADAVHQMRVVTRKIRSLLQASQDASVLSDTAWIVDELRELAGVLGSARDAEVLAQRYQQALDALPAELVRGPVAERLVDDAWRRYQAGLRRSQIALRSQRYFRLLDALDALVAELAAAGAGSESASVTIDAAFQHVRKAAKGAAEASDEHHDEALHRIRKKAKRLRYTAAATGAATVSAQARAIQTLLGDHQDSVVSRAHLGQQATAARAAGEDTFTYGVLYQQEADLAQRCRQQLDAALDKLGEAVRAAAK